MAKQINFLQIAGSGTESRGIVRHCRTARVTSRTCATRAVTRVTRLPRTTARTEVRFLPHYGGGGRGLVMEID